MPSPFTVTTMHEGSRVFEARRVVTSSEAASLHGKKALTPIIAGSICGGIMVISWVIGFAVYFRKRWNRKKRNRLIAEGKAQPREKDLKPLQEKVVIPPDPAVLLGQRKPGEMLFPERQHSSSGHLHVPWSRQNSRILPKSDSNPSQNGDSEAIPSSDSKVTNKSQTSPRMTQEETLSNPPATSPQHPPQPDKAEPTSTNHTTTTHNTHEDKGDIHIVDEMTIPANV